MEKNPEKDSCPKGYLLTFNVQCKNNFGTLVRSAAAFNIDELFIVDSKNQKKPNTFGSQGTAKKSVFRYFDKLK